ncbi:hypothetical protein DCAR_0520629 [Daucus carota subsp. sativus]|uniref:Uncharacterized protein n=1 Tax=Daucus carota subsp. sativus TaxID=79200 RepID=A0A164YNJ9_DAUCS|nr:hypothetical protein DCAR_0520629 [Daucus carota subsp. sativus]
MCLIVCDEQGSEVERKTASGNCPHCGGKVEAVDVETRSKLCCLIPVCFQIKRKFQCAVCFKRLVLSYYPS